MTGEPIENIEERFSVNPFQGKVNPGDIRGIADRPRWFLRSVHEVVTLMFPDRAPDLEEIEAFAKSLEVGIPRKAIGLLEIGPALQRGEYLALSRAGILDARAFESVDRSQLASILGHERTKQLRPESKDDSASVPEPTN